MKRYTFYVLLLSVAAMAACQKQSVIEEPQASQNGTYIYTMKASSPVTKSDYDGSGNFSWSAGDAISVLFHKGDDNKFFTLTTTEDDGDKTAAFSGAVDDGYTIGASDATVSDKKIWVLYPASTSHSYTTGNYPKFYTAAEKDYAASGAHFSANLPMYAHLNTEGDITFTYIASAYKFTVTGLDESVNKVKLTVYNQATYGISGLFPLALDGESTIYLNTGYTDEGVAGRTLTQTVNKSGSSAEFYVPCRWYGEFKPEIFIYNAENNYTLKHILATNTKTPSSMTEVKPISIAASGTGSAESIGVNWASVPDDHTFAGINDRIVEWKAASDASNIYFQYKFTKAKYKKDGSSKFYIGFNTDADSETGGNASGNLGGGFEARAYFYPWVDGNSDGAPKSVYSGLNPLSFVQTYVGTKWTTKTGVKVVSHGTIDGSYVYIEVSIPRTSVGIGVGNTVTVMHSAQDYVTNAESVSF